MHIDFLLKVFAANVEKPAIIWRDVEYDYGWMLARVEYWNAVLKEEGIPRGSVVTLEADFSPSSVSLFLALVQHECVLVPLTSSVNAKKSEFVKIAQGEFSFSIDEEDNVRVTRLPNVGDHEIYLRLKRARHPGLVLFSSGSTGKSKAAVHDLVGLLEKFHTARHARRTIAFLLYDHIGGVNTMLYTLSNGGCIITIQDHSPDGVLGAVEKHKAELLPTSPTFINLILLSEAYRRHDVSSLQMITYGTEPMPESTLRRIHEVLPQVELLQTYGLSEIGILRSKSKSSGSLWVKIGGEGYETRIVDGILQVRARSAMLGYLNAANPFTEDGWFNTGDAVQLDGEYMRILGRDSEIINVGGEKVYPAEVESVIQEVDNVAEVSVYPEKNPLVGNIVCARIRLIQPEESIALRVKEHCRAKLQRYKVPVKISIVSENQYSARFKKMRRVDG